MQGSFHRPQHSQDVTCRNSAHMTNPEIFRLDGSMEPARQGNARLSNARQEVCPRHASREAGSRQGIGCRLGTNRHLPQAQRTNSRLECP